MQWIIFRITTGDFVLNHYLFKLTAISLFAGVITISARASMLQPDTKSTSTVNVYGKPVVDSAGQHINYQSAQLKGLNPIQEFTFEGKEATSGRADLTPRTTPNDRPFWTFPILQSGIGISNIVTGQGSNGKAEIYVGSGGSSFGTNTYWMALSWDQSSGKYQPTFSSEMYPAGISRIVCGDVTGNDDPEIVVGLRNGEIHVFDQTTKEWLSSFQAVGSLAGMRVANLDGLGKNEVIVCNSTTLAVYSEGSLQWSVAAAGGNDLVTAQMDGDAALEIAVSTGKVVDSQSHTVQWNRGSNFGANLQAADIDNDGMDELVAAEGWYYVWAFDVDTQFPKWSYRTDLDNTALQIADVDGDSKVEIIIGDGQWGDVYAIDPVTQAKKWFIKNPEHGVSSIAVADVDGDSLNEIIWGCGYSSTGQDLLCVGNPVTKAIEWNSIHLDGPIIGPVKGDLDGDGEDEIVAATYESRSSYSSGRIMVFDALTLRLRGLSDPICGDRAWTGLHDLKLADLNGDGKKEILVAADWLYDGVIEAYNFNSNNQFSLAWTNSTRPDGSPFYSVEVADLDGDGEMEIIGGVGQAHSGSDGTFVYVYGYTSHAQEWRSFSLTGSWGTVKDVAVADVDTTPGLEILAVTGNKLYIFDGNTKAPRAIIDGSFGPVEILEKSIFTSSNTGLLAKYDFNGSQYTQTTSTQLIAGPVDGFQVQSLLPLRVNFGSGGRLYEYNNGVVTPESLNFGIPYGAKFIDGVTAGSFSVASHRLPSPELDEEPTTTSGAMNKLWWKPVSGAKEYLIQSDTDMTFSSPKSSGWVKGLSVVLYGLPTNQDNFFRIKARDKSGAIESEWSRLESSFQVPTQSAAKYWSLYE